MSELPASDRSMSDRSMSDIPAITLADVESAAALLDGVAVRTPLLEFEALNARVGGRVLLKCEGFQHTGSFKFRGAYNRLARLAPAERAAGVVAFSSGNHAQGVADAARRLGMRATIVMPADAPAIKLANTRALGAEVVTYDRLRESREAIAARIAAERGSVLVPAFDDPYVMAGQGTIGLEIAAQAAERGVAVDQAVACCAGGGLSSGIAVALAGRSPATRLYATEPAGHDDLARSLQSGRREVNEPGTRSICDALLVVQPGELTFPILRARLSGVLVVTDPEVRDAMRLAFRDLKLVVEPGGAAALAAVLAGRLETRGRVTAVTLSGANVDPEAFARVLTSTG
ncbi:MAG: threonine/serine dehydratase [Pseudomonadota bacterium]